MSPSAQKRLGACEIISLIGEGGMGKVFKARDTRLGREVAVKILLDEFATDPERMTRLAREARILASLNHPNIASIYSLEECDGVRALVMEYVDGPTLSDRLKAGPLPVSDALEVAGQIAEGLHYAHDRGVIHRDLKPANIKVTNDGTVKLLDFGLARALEGEPDSGDPATSPTLTLAATRAGVILGTAGYMSPEQARGKPADRRADIWAFGVVLYEILTGHRLFAGETVSDSLAGVLKEPIDWSRLPADTPSSIRRLLRRCLERDPKLRLNDIGDACLEIREAKEGDTPEGVPVSRRPHRLPFILAGAMAVAGVLSFAAWRMLESPSDAPLIRLPVDLGPDAALISAWGTNAAISPDGTRIAYVVRRPDGQVQLATRLLSRSETVMLAGTEGAQNPFFSPDSEWVGFFADGKLKKVPVNGGSALEISTAGSLVTGASWGAGDIIIAELRPGAGLSRVPSSGGEPQVVTKPDEKAGENTHRWPQILPDGDSVLFTAGAGLAIHETGRVVILSLRDGRRKVLRTGAYFGRYVPGGHLLYMEQGKLFAVRFDAANWEISGTTVALIDDLAHNPQNGGALFDFSRNGVFIYVDGDSQGYTSQPSWVGRNGRPEPLSTIPVGFYGSPRVSPDGRRVALTRVLGQAQDIWVWDLERAVPVRLTVTPHSESSPVWTPDASHVVFASGSFSETAIFSVRADGSSPARQLVKGEKRQIPFSFSPDGRTLAYVEVATGTGFDIWSVAISRDAVGDLIAGERKLFLREPSTQWAPAFSPDGRWLAYTSGESGKFEVYVRPFPDGGARWQVSDAGGGMAVWSQTRPELLYRTTDERIAVVEYTVKDGSFFPHKRSLWSPEVRGRPLFIWSSYDISPDGKRILALVPPPSEANSIVGRRLTFLLNYFDELRRRVP